MPEVKFIYNKEKDLFNIWETCTSKSYGYDFSKKLPKELVKYCKVKSYKDSRQFIERLFFDTQSSELIKIQEDAINKAWKKIEKNYFSRLHSITEKRLSLTKINGYITIAPRCPYLLGEGNFMVSFFAGIPSALLTAGHELMHLHFHEHYFDKIEKKIGNKKAHDLKEALTVLLNVEFQDLWLISDNGYDSHKRLRGFILKEWKKERNFERLLEKSVKFQKGI